MARKFREGRFRNGPVRMKVQVVRLEMVRERDMTYAANAVNNPHIAVELLRSFIGPADREHFVLLALDNKNKPVLLNAVSVGILNASVVHPREVFKAAIIANAAAVIVAHNHPSGDVTPSPEDREVTDRLKKAGELLGIELMDSLVVSDQTYFSFWEHGLLKKEGQSA